VPALLAGVIVLQEALKQLENSCHKVADPLVSPHDQQVNQLLWEARNVLEALQTLDPHRPISQLLAQVQV
jgi:hypothetical protein